MTPTRRFVAAASLALVLATGLAACGSSSSPPSSSSSSSSTTTTMSAATAKAQIRTAFSTLFALSDPALEPKLAVVQDGEKLRQAIGDALKSPIAERAAGAEVKTIELERGSACTSETLTSPCARVTYSILSPSNAVLLANAKGFALLVGSKWLVSKTTICTLLTLANGNVPPKGC